MIRPGMVFSVAAGESRIARRLVRYWVFTLLAGLAAALMYGWYAFIHGIGSSYSATVAMINPRFIMGFAAFWFLCIFFVGLVVLAFEVRARDTRERIAEVVDTVPISNLELMLGRYVGLLRVNWIPVVFICLTMFVVSLILGQPLEPRSVFNMIVSMAIPAFTFMLGLTFFITVLFRYRVLVFFATIVAIGAVITANWLSPSWLSPLTDVTGAFNLPFPSELAPELLPWPSLTQRLGVFLVGLGLVVLSAGIHPRPDDGKRGMVFGGLGIVAAGIALLLTALFASLAIKSDFERRREAHRALMEEPAADLVSMTGTLDIRPGKKMTLEISQEIAAPSDTTLDRGVFSLNPGLRVTALTVDGSPVSVEQRDGLVLFDWSALPANATRTLEWSVEGEPDVLYGYLDTARNLWDVQVLDGNAFMLGYENGMFRKTHVSLMPGIRWFPAPGVDVGRNDPRHRPTDYFSLDLTVTVPDGWTIAGPGRREELADGEFRFRPSAPVPTPALIAGRYESRSTEVEGVRLEVLVHPDHTKNLEVLSEAASEIETRLGETLRDAEAMGLGYPYDALTLVEVPNQLRGYGGGWRLDSVMGAPGLAMMRESGFPTAAFEPLFEDPESLEDQEGGLATAKYQAVERFFENDFTGGNLFPVLGKNFFKHQTSARGSAGLPLEWVHDALSTELTTGRSSYFSAFLLDRNLGQLINPALMRYFNDSDAQRSGFADTFIDLMTSSPSVWDQVLQVSLLDMQPEEDPKRTINVLTLKGDAMARSLVDGLGRDKAGAFLGALRARTQGRSYDREDVVEAARSVDVDLEPWLDLWLSKTELPGFVIDRIRHLRLTDDEDGAARYAVSFVARNEEPVPGMMRVRYSVEGEDDWVDLDPQRVEGESAWQVSIVSRQPIDRVRVDPYLSLNRGAFDLVLGPRLDDERIDEDLETGYREIEYELPDDGTIVVDDLSEGFEIVVDDENTRKRLGARDPNKEYDAGLPVMVPGVSPKEWSRTERAQAYGRYRHTYALRRTGSGASKAVFSADIPRAGSWELEYYLARPRKETWTLEVVDSAGSATTLQFDAEAGTVGWNSLGTVEVDAGTARVEISDDAGDRWVYADAVRWTPPKRRE